MPTPSQNSAEFFGEDEEEILDAFSADVLGVTEEAAYFAGGSCDGLADAARADPQMFSRMRSFGELLRRMSSRDQVLNNPYVRRILDEMDQALAALNRTLATCGIQAARVPSHQSTGEG